MTTFGAHAFVWAAEWDAEGAETAMRGAAARGLEFIEIPLLTDPAQFPLERTRELIEETGLAVTASLGLPKDKHMPFNPDGAREHLRGVIELISALGGDTLTGGLQTHLGTLTRKPPTAEELDTCVRTLREVAVIADAHGVRLALENINRYETYINNTVDQVAEMIERIGSDNVYAHVDTYHMIIEERGFRAPIERLGDRLIYMHLSESDRGTPGKGNVRWDDVFAGLQAIGYDGYLAMESFVAVNEDIIGATAIWRDIVGDPDVLIRDGLEFLQGKAKRFGVW